MPFRILVALGVEIFASIACLTTPYWGFVFFMFWTILRPQDDRPNIQGLHYPMVLLISVLLGTVPRMAGAAAFSIARAVQKLGLIFLYFIVMVASAVASGYTPQSSYRVNEFLTVVLTCLMIIYWGSNATKLWGILGAFFFAGLQISRDALTRSHTMIEQIGGQKFDRLTINRLNGNFGSPNYIALLMSVLILVCLSFLYTKYPKWLKVAAAGSTGLFFISFLKANSRGASLGLAAGLLVFFIFQKRKAVTALILVVVAAGVLMFAPASYFDRLKTIGSYQQDASATLRLQLWEIGINLVKSHPVLGVGPDNFTNYAFNSPHDAYIQAAAEMGIPAMFLYCIILISGLVASIRALRLASKLPDAANLRALCVAVTCMIAHIIVQGFTTGFAHREFVYFFITFAYCTYLVASDQAKAAAQSVPDPPTRLVRPPRTGVIATA